MPDVYHHWYWITMVCSNISNTIVLINTQLIPIYGYDVRYV